MSDDIVNRAMSFIFDHDKKLLAEKTIELLELHRQTSAGGRVLDLFNVAVRYENTIWSHPARPKQTRASGMQPLTTVQVLPEHEKRAKNLQEDYRLLEKDSRRAQKTLTQLVRGIQGEQDIRDNFPECLAVKLGLAHLPRTREPAWRYSKMDERVYQNMLKDLDMIQGYFDSRLIL